MSNYGLTGLPGFNAPDSKMPYIREGVTKNGAPYKSFNMYVSQAKNNRANVECFGMPYKTIKGFDQEGQKIEIAWEDRLDADVVAQFRNKHIIDLGDGNRKEFIAELDTIEYICDHIDEIKDKKVLVTGTITKNVYQGKISDRFQLKNLYVVNDENKNAFKITMKFFWNNESFDFENWKDEKKIYINGYTSEYLDKNTLGAEAGANRYVPQQLVFDCSKLDFDNEKHVALMKFKMNQMGIDYVDGKPKATIKGGKYYSLNVIVAYQNGAEEVAFDESTLTATQKEAVLLGLKSIEDFKPAGSIYGNRVTIYKLTDFDLRGVYEDGKVECDETKAEFEELIFVPVQPEKVDNLEETTTTNNDDDDDSDDDLFS